MSRKIAMLANAAEFLRSEGYIQEALEVWEALSWGDETYEAGDYAFEIGRCYEALGNRQNALRFYEIAFRENPSVPGRKQAVERLREAS
jgi:tetratricopeptide (TPR) repeat protein